MKLMYGNVPVKSMNIHHFEMDTNSATMVPSDLQAGVTAFAKGKKVTGTGRCFEFATYGKFKTNSVIFIPSIINTIEIASLDYPIKSMIALSDMVDVDFSIEQTIGSVIIDDIEYPITVTIENSILTLNCEQTISLQVFLGRDNYA